MADQLRIKNVFVTFSASVSTPLSLVCFAYRQNVSMSCQRYDLKSLPSARADGLVPLVVRMVDGKQAIAQIAGTGNDTTVSRSVAAHCSSKCGRYSAWYFTPGMDEFNEIVSCDDIFESVVPGTAVTTVKIDIPPESSGFKLETLLPLRV
ncbi:hypothetical protein T10_11543 [Trichinella papuae]|uniref:Uncharacterized protein n=1 Tax=Trichinella papuae TaxID=268474 RepID=A0A0V1LZ92_9BILA|nr:hypothetical protein T10_11543 [Trichinella papuae]